MNHKISYTFPPSPEENLHTTPQKQRLRYPQKLLHSIHLNLNLRRLANRHPRLTPRQLRWTPRGRLCERNANGVLTGAATAKDLDVGASIPLYRVKLVIGDHPVDARLRRMGNQHGHRFMYDVCGLFDV